MTPDGAASLIARTHDALDELASIHDHDPAAAGAMRAIRLTEYTLDRFWLPALDRIAGADER